MNIVIIFNLSILLNMQGETFNSVCSFYDICILLLVGERDTINLENQGYTYGMPFCPDLAFHQEFLLPATA